MGEKEMSTTFPIPLRISIDTKDIIENVLSMHNEPETENQREEPQHPPMKKRTCPTPPPEERRSLESSTKITKRSPRTTKLQRSLKKAIPADMQRECEDDTIETEWERIKDVRQPQLKEQPEADDEIVLLWQCFENNLSSLASAAQQMNALSQLLKLKKIGKEQIQRKIRENPKLKENMRSVSRAVEQIRDVIIDSDYSHALM